MTIPRNVFQIATVNNKKPSKLALAVSFIFFGTLLIFGGQNNYYQEKKQEISQRLSGSFEEEPIVLNGFKDTSQIGSKLPVRIVIPSLTIDLLVNKANVINGYWEVFPDKAGWGVESGVPGQSGNTVVFAHAKEGLFGPLRKIREGSKVYIMTKETWYEYSVDDIQEVFPTQTQVIEDSEEEILTLYTCSGFADSKRLIVKAKRLIP